MSRLVLVVDDDEVIGRLVRVVMEKEGFDVEVAKSAMEAFDRLEKRPPDLVLLDIVLPAISGLEVLESLGRREERVPVILLSSLDAEENKVRGLQLGADDYVTKPFSSRELIARVHAVLRRTRPGAAAGRLTLDDVRIDLDSRQVFVGDELVTTTMKEFDLLAYLVRQPGKVFTREQLLRDVWSSSSEWQGAATVTEHVGRLRAKLGEAGERHLHTVRGVGYRFDRRSSPR